MEKKKFPFPPSNTLRSKLRKSIHSQRLLIRQLALRATGWPLFKPIRPLKLYWQAYGGWTGFFQSFYLYLALIITLGTFPLWLKLDGEGNRVWASMPTSILPNLLGFSMGGMAIMLAFAGSKIFIYLSEEGKNHSYFVKIVASFYHFIVVQTVAIFMGLICQSYSWVALSFFGYWSMCYALLVAPATAAQLFNTARIANIAASIPDDDSANTSH